MKNKDFLEEYLEDDLISKIYRNDCDFTQKMIKSREYTEVLKNLKRKEKQLIELETFRKYLEIRNIKDSIEAEEQFKIGFKFAVKIIIESYHS